MSEFRNKIARHVNNLRGWRTRRKIMVIESDDWGSVRMPSREVFQKCLDAGFPVDRSPYDRYDSLLSSNDLELLFEVLSRYRDFHGRHPVITANCVVANPDFEKIRQNGSDRYHFELITETFSRNPAHERNFELWKQGMRSALFFPQYHAREHLDVSYFMGELGKGSEEALFGLENSMPGCHPKRPGAGGNLYVEALTYRNRKDMEEKLAIYLDGLDIFEKLFGYRSESIIPPNYAWNPAFDGAVFEKGVRFIQGNRKIRIPAGDGTSRFQPYHMGWTSDLGLVYLFRNALFEPSMWTMGVNDPVGRCLTDMAIAFRMRKPAIIVSHRLNYSGHLDPRNRDRTLQMLDLLIGRALHQWPDLEFMTTPGLGRLIASGPSLSPENR